MIYNYNVGVYETLTLEDIGTATGAARFIKIENGFTNIYADLDLFTDSGGTVQVPYSSYDFIGENEIITGLEVGNSDKTAYKAFQVTDPTYQGITLYATFSNFGTYTDNQAIVDYITAPMVRAEYHSFSELVANQPMKYLNKVEDTHSAYDPLTGQFACPYDGLYELEDSTLTGENTLLHSYYLYKENVSAVFVDQRVGLGVLFGVGLPTKKVRCLAGDKLDIRCNRSLIYDAPSIYRLAITRIGN